MYDHLVSHQSTERGDKILGLAVRDEKEMRETGQRTLVSRRFIVQMHTQLMHHAEGTTNAELRPRCRTAYSETCCRPLTLAARLKVQPPVPKKGAQIFI